MLGAIRHSFPWLRHVFADSACAGDKVRAALARIGKWTVEVIKRSDAAKGFVLLPRRRVVERTHAKDFERSIASATAWLFMVFVQLLTRRIARD